MAVGTSVKRAGVNGAVAAISRQELREGASHVVTNKGGDDIFFAIWDDKVMTGVGLSPILDPARSWVDAGLRTRGTRGLPFGVSFLCLDQGLLRCKFVIKYDRHASVVKGGCTDHGLMRGRNGKWFRAGRGAVGIRWVDDVCKFVAGVEGERVRNRNMTTGRRGVNRKKGAIRGELAADFIFLDIEDTSDVLDHLLMGNSHF